MDSSVPVEPWLRQLIGDAQLPARKIKPSRVSITGYVSTSKAPVAQDAESALEHDFFTLLKFNRRVTGFRSQALTIRWTDRQGVSHRYTLDAIARYARFSETGVLQYQPKAFEVKPSDILKRDWAEFKPKFRAAISWGRERDVRFHIVTERQIRGDYLINARFLLGYRDLHLDPGPASDARHQILVRKTLFRLNTATPRTLLSAITTDRTLQAALIPWIWKLIDLERIGADLCVRLSMASPIWTLDTEVSLEELG